MISHFFTRPPPAAGRASDILPFRCSAIRTRRFYFIGRISYEIKKYIFSI